jgi:hypothetical protein
VRAVLISCAPPVAVKISELLAELGHQGAGGRGAARRSATGLTTPSGPHDVVPAGNLLCGRLGGPQPPSRQSAKWSTTSVPPSGGLRISKDADSCAMRHSPSPSPGLSLRGVRPMPPS